MYWIMLTLLRIFLAVAVLSAFARARNRAMSRWAIAVAEDYVGMSLEEYAKVNKSRNSDEA